MEYIVTTISIIGSIASTIALIIQLQGQKERFKVYILLSVILLLTAVASFSLANVISLKKLNTKLIEETSITNQTLATVNSIMIEIEDFNNMLSLPKGQENEYISDFEYNIREAAQELRELQKRTQRLYKNSD